jgi:hypothetical protein
MNTTRTRAPRSAIIDPSADRRERRSITLRSRLVAAGASVGLAIALAACSPGASIQPVPSFALPSALPSVNASALASAAAGAALTALDQVDAAITANTTASGLTADDASALKQLTTAARTALQTGDTAAARTAIDNLATKVTSLASKLPADTGAQLTSALTALKAALPAS